MKVYFGFTLADSMFVGDCIMFIGDCIICHRQLSVDDVKKIVEQGVESCLNPSHIAIINAMRSKHGIDVHIPETPPKIVLGKGDSVIVMGVHGLPRLTDRHEYTSEEIEKAEFVFSIYMIK